MYIKKEWLCLLVVLIIFYLDSIIEVGNENIYISKKPGIDFLFLLYHTILFWFVSYVLIPKFFYTKKYVLFALALVGSIIVFGIVEEGMIEKILTPNSRGKNDVTWQSIYWFFGEILVPLLAFVSIKFTFDNIEQQRRLEQIEKDNLTNELKLLKSQIQPHILFNSLNNLYNFALAKSDEVPDLILKLANVLRYVLYETTTDKVALSKELAFVKDYIDLQKIQFEGRGIINYDLVEKDIQALKITPFIIIPFIENSFKHSFGTLIKEVKIDIKIRMTEEQLFFSVTNNFKKQNNKSEDLLHSGIGLKNVEKRLNLLYPNQHQLEYNITEDTYQVQLNLDLNG